MSRFADHFSPQAPDYARYRPTYPDALFAWLTSLCPTHTCAWDCGTGNGQAARALTAYFPRIIATEPSAAQLAQATPHPQIEYRQEPAEATSLDDHSVELVTVAQALHWFDHEKFYREVRRVLKPRGVVAAWTYTMGRVNPAVDAVVDHYYQEVVGPYWPPERRLVETAYQTIPFPFEEIEAPPFEIERQLALADLVGYLRTWSARKRFLEQNGTDPLDVVLADLEAAWGDPVQEREMRWVLPVRAGYYRG